MVPYKNPKHLAIAIKTKVLRQDDAVDMISQYLFQYILYHYSATGQFKLQNKPQLLLLGPSGHGKTHLVRTLAAEMNFDLIEINAKSISQEGWSGTSFKDLLSSELEGFSQEQVDSERRIVLIDEFDKICQPLGSSSNDNYSPHVQSSLLKYMENYTFKLPKSNVIVDTKNFCFIFSGNFQALRDSRKEEPTIGFQEQVTEKQNDLTVELEQYGMVPEIVGRLSHFIELRELTKEDIRAAMAEQGFALVQYENLLNNLGFENVSFDKEAILDNIIDYRLGFRGVIQEFNKQVNQVCAENSDKFSKMFDYFEYLKNSQQLEEELNIKRKFMK